MFRLTSIGFLFMISQICFAQNIIGKMSNLELPQGSETSGFRIGEILDADEPSTFSQLNFYIPVGDGKHGGGTVYLLSSDQTYYLDVHDGRMGTTALAREGDGKIYRVGFGPFILVAGPLERMNGYSPRSDVLPDVGREDVDKLVLNTLLKLNPDSSFELIKNTKAAIPPAEIVAEFNVGPAHLDGEILAYEASDNATTLTIKGRWSNVYSIPLLSANDFRKAREKFVNKMKENMAKKDKPEEEGN